MSNTLFPSSMPVFGLPGEAWSVDKKPYFSTIQQKATSGQETRIANWPYPLTEYTIPFSVLDASKGQMQTLWGYYVARIGPWDSFLYYDVTDFWTVQNAINENLGPPTTAQNQIGTGDGITTIFQITRNLGGGIQPVLAINGITITVGTPPACVVYLNGVAQSSSTYSISSAGVLTFTSAPGAGVAIQWDGGYLWRCVFADDFLDFENFVQSLFSSKSVRIRQVWS
jgi:uncharacterized protein (TIGR02217 family)